MLVTAVSVWLGWVNVVRLQLPFAQRCVFLLIRAPQHALPLGDQSEGGLCARLSAALSIGFVP